jgi:hypothetical protein
MSTIAPKQAFSIHIFSIPHDLRVEAPAAICGAGRHAGRFDQVIAPWDDPSVCQGCVAVAQRHHAGGYTHLGGAIVGSTDMQVDQSTAPGWFVGEVTRATERAAQLQAAVRAANALKVAEMLAEQQRVQALDG